MRPQEYSFAKTSTCPITRVPIWKWPSGVSPASMYRRTPLVAVVGTRVTTTKSLGTIDALEPLRASRAPREEASIVIVGL